MNRNLSNTAVIFVLVVLLAGCGSDDTKTKKDTRSKTNSNNSTAMTNASDIKSGGFAANLPDGFTQPTDDVRRKLIKEYGAVFVAKGGATPPNTVVFKDDAEVSTFQSRAGSTRETVGGVSIELQPAAMQELKDAVADAKQNGASITPKGADAAKRSYQDTVGLWASRVDPGLAHWVASGRVSQADAQRIKALSPYEQVPEIFKLEEQGIYFSKDLSKSIIYSVAPPGTSQHLSMLALDVAEFENLQVRSILAKHGWYQTVVSDLPHFTFLGVAESNLPKLGLKKVNDGGRVFWLPET